MKLVKSLLLGSAAGLFAAAGAQAADLPRKAAAPVEYVRVCSTYGAGFFFIPGTDTCLRLSGFVRAETLYLEPFDRRDDALGFRARGRVQWDARTATEYGLLRSFIRMEMFRNTGAFVRTSETSARRGSLENSLSLNKGFIQFGNLTAGRFQSFFDFYANDYNYTTIFGMSDITTNGLAWTQPFGGGFSATLAIEDPLERRNIGVADVFTFPGTGGFVAPGTFGLSPINLTPGGTRAPDLVANLRIDQAWGSAQLSGAAHQIRSAVLLSPGAAAITGVPAPGVPAVAAGCPTVAGGGFTPVAGGFCDFSDDEWGFAIQGGVKINLPMIAAGDELWLQAVWSTGAIGYATSGGTRVFGGTGSGTGTTAIAVRQTEAFIDPFTGDVEKVDAFSVAAVFRHYWTPNLRSIFFGAFTEVDNPQAAFSVTTVTGAGVAAPLGTVTTAGFADFRMYEAGASLIWSPVRNLDIGVEGVYRRLDPKGNVPLAVGGVAGIPTVLGSPVTRGSDDVWEARLRIQRDF